jgi:hypothetical protein
MRDTSLDAADSYATLPDGVIELHRGASPLDVIAKVNAALAARGFQLVDITQAGCEPITYLLVGPEGAQPQ